MKPSMKEQAFPCQKLNIWRLTDALLDPCYTLTNRGHTHRGSEMPSSIEKLKNGSAGQYPEYVDVLTRLDSDLPPGSDAPATVVIAGSFQLFRQAARAFCEGPPYRFSVAALHEGEAAAALVWREPRRLADQPLHIVLRGVQA